MYNLHFNLELAQSYINELEKLVINWDAHILLEWEKNLKAFQEINAKLIEKDKRILKLLNNINTLMDRLSRLNS